MARKISKANACTFVKHLGMRVSAGVDQQLACLGTSALHSAKKHRPASGGIVQLLRSVMAVWSRAQQQVEHRH
jgi:hypothetical protein